MKEIYKLRPSVDHLVLIVENSLEGIDILMEKPKEFGVVAEFKMNKD